MWSSIKTYRLKVRTKNIFYGNPRPSLWTWRAQAGRFCVYREASLIAPSCSENEQVSCCCRKFGSKVKKRGASRDVHAGLRNILVANFILAIKPVHELIMHICCISVLDYWGGPERVPHRCERYVQIIIIIIL